MIGRDLGHYKILEELAEGGMGIVYRAVDTRLDRQVAVKVLRPDALSSVERRKRFVQEAKAASALNHPSIVTIHDIGTATLHGLETDYIAMELVEGETLSQRIEKGLSIQQTLDYATQMVRALAAAHRAGIVHRDVKPANVMVTTDGRLKVLDFGLAKLVEPLENSDDEAPTRAADVRTRKGAVLGTAAYMSPEQAEGRAVDARSDVFSFGVVLYEMLTGRQPFRGDSFVATRMAILRNEPPSPREISKAVPDALERIVERCLKKSKEDRFASASEVLEALDGLSAASRGAPKWPWVAAVVVLLVASGIWLQREASRRHVREEVLPEMTRLVDEGMFFAALQFGG